MSKSNRAALALKHEKATSERLWRREAHRHAHPELYPTAHEQLEELLKEL